MHELAERLEPMEQLMENPVSKKEKSTGIPANLATVDAAGNRVWLYPRAPKGAIHRARKAVAFLLLGVLFSVPFIKVDGQPFFLFNVFERHFVILGQPFFPQDFHLLGLAMIIFFVFITLFTVVFGRVWCGWACPQTIFMEMVFRKIEYWIEGDANQQKALDKAPWDTRKLFKKTAKHSIFALFSVIISHLVMAYLIGLEGVYRTITHSPAANWAGFTGLVAFTGIFYFVFARLREQVCTVVCPYGRLQSVLLNRDSVIVAYDYLRGEPRGKQSKKAKKHSCEGACFSCPVKTGEEQPGTAADAVVRPLTCQDLLPKGDCIDCRMCVQVCPTGIDIRQGLQMECINCMACVDACNTVMKKIGKPEGLIRLDSQRGIEEKKPFRVTSRIIAYSVVLLALLTLQGYLIVSRTLVEATVLRVPGMLYQQQPNGQISNLYNAQLLNKSYEDLPVTLHLHPQEGVPAGQIRVIGEKIILKKSQATDVVFFIDLPKAELKATKTRLLIDVYAGDQLVETVKTNFLGPTN
jgi:polyferredoxin